jgi:hypothetical protein
MSTRSATRHSRLGSVPSVWRRLSPRTSPLASRLLPCHQCEIHLARRHPRDPLASRLSPLALPPMRDKSRATPLSGLSPRPSPPMRDTSRTTPWSGPARLSPLASRLSPLASRLSPLASRLSPLASRLSPLASRLSPLASRLSPLASRLSRSIDHANDKSMRKYLCAVTQIIDLSSRPVSSHRHGVTLLQ